MTSNSTAYNREYWRKNKHRYIRNGKRRIRKDKLASGINHDEEMNNIAERIRTYYAERRSHEL